MKLFRDLNEADQKRHLQIASRLCVGKMYRFPTAVRGEPFSRHPLCQQGAVVFRRARFMTFRGRGNFKDCLFFTRGGLVSVLFTEDVPEPEEVKAN